VSPRGPRGRDAFYGVLERLGVGHLDLAGALAAHGVGHCGRHPWPERPSPLSTSSDPPVAPAAN
jgi:hypothetical protein